MISSLHNKGIEAVLVSSGAMGFIQCPRSEKRPAEVGKQHCLKCRAVGHDEPFIRKVFLTHKQGTSFF